VTNWAISLTVEVREGTDKEHIPLWQ
jgi:hypothetical protein